MYALYDDDAAYLQCDNINTEVYIVLLAMNVPIRERNQWPVQINMCFLLYSAKCARALWGIIMMKQVEAHSTIILLVNITLLFLWSIIK